MRDGLATARLALVPREDVQGDHGQRGGGGADRSSPPPDALRCLHQQLGGRDPRHGARSEAQARGQREGKGLRGARGGETLRWHTKEQCEMAGGVGQQTSHPRPLPQLL